MPETSVDELWRRWKSAGDEHARERLIIHYSPLVKLVVSRVRAGLPASVEQADLVSEGVIGLMDAIDKFDPRRRLQFPTYAVPRIRGAIIDSLRASDWVPRSTRDQFRAHDRVRADLGHRLMREPTLAEVAAELGIPAEEVQRTCDEQTLAGMVNLEHDDEADNEALQTVDHILEAGAALPAGFGAAVRTLPERDQIVIALYYWEELTLLDIGRILGVGESRVSQLHSRATSSLRKALLAAAERR